MSKPSKDLIISTILKLSYESHKGVAGRIGIIGGSQEYTGAPYFAAISSLKTGCDLSYVFCTKEAATPIKSYSPDLIVLPILSSKNICDQMKQWLQKLHAIVFGPGLGRHFPIQVIENLLKLIISSNLPLIIDADGLFYINNLKAVINGYTKAILTPNIIEFKRLEENFAGKVDENIELINRVKMMANNLNGVTITCKGAVDIISDGNLVYLCEEHGSLRRCGGQGDVLAGSMGTFIHWAFLSKQSSVNPCMLAAYISCYLTRRCNKQAFMHHGRSMITSDIICYIGKTVSEL